MRPTRRGAREAVAGTWSAKAIGADGYREVGEGGSGACASELAVRAGNEISKTQLPAEVHPFSDSDDGRYCY